MQFCRGRPGLASLPESVVLFGKQRTLATAEAENDEAIASCSEAKTLYSILLCVKGVYSVSVPLD